MLCIAHFLFCTSNPGAALRGMEAIAPILVRTTSKKIQEIGNFIKKALLCINALSHEHYNSNKQDIGFSYRVMWRAGGQAEAYVYTTGRQDPSLERVAGFIEDPDIGSSIGRGVQNFIAGQWNTVKLFMRLNTFR